MYHRIAHIALVVDDYDEAIEFDTNKLDFKLLEDTKLSDEKIRVMVAPQGAKECCLLLAKAANEQQAASVGNQAGGRVFPSPDHGQLAYSYVTTWDDSSTPLLSTVLLV